MRSCAQTHGVTFLLSHDEKQRDAFTRIRVCDLFTRPPPLPSLRRYFTGAAFREVQLGLGDLEQIACGTADGMSYLHMACKRA